MNRKYGVATYTTRTVEDRRAGSAGLELYREVNGRSECAASLVFWDAEGQFRLQTFREVPLDIVEQLISETKQAIKTK
ncbi:MAG: hypothetical protein BIFFINMI_04329 [Phycisphaerae bacterium]|nr:hypothetical protein [Phycisphaerae bacterium]